MPKAIFGLIGLFGAFGQVAMAGGVEISSFGHSALLIKGGGQTVLLNPFKSVGCASGLKEPRVKANIILASSQLADEGSRGIAKGLFLVEPGSYRIKNLNFEGISVPHDRLGGRRYGSATLWYWTQGGLTFAHLGGAVAPLTASQKILLGRPDVLVIAVGGGAKVYNGKEAARVVEDLNPKHVIPVQYVSRKSSEDCDQIGIEPFLKELKKDILVKKTGAYLSLSRKKSDKITVNIMH